MRTPAVLACVLACAIALLAQDAPDRQRHVAAADNALRAEQDREKGTDCADAKNQREEDLCLSKIGEEADRNLTTFYENLKAILPADAQKKLHASEQSWLLYRRNTCDAVFQFYKSGTIRNSAEARCEIRLTRERLHDLDYLYDSPLHH